MRVAEFNAQGIANMLNALAKFDHYEAALVGRLTMEALGKAGMFTAQGIANTAWTFPTTDNSRLDNFSKLVEQSLKTCVIFLQT